MDRPMFNKLVQYARVVGDSGWFYIGAWVLSGGSGSLGEGEMQQILIVKYQFTSCILYTH